MDEYSSNLDPLVESESEALLFPASFGVRGWTDGYID